MSMDRPQYGEYASPEEQRARAGLPPLEQTPTASAPPPAPPAALSPRHTQQQAHVATQARRPAGRADRLIAMVLLGIGLVNVLTSIPGFLQLSDSLDQSLKMLGVDADFSNFQAARVWGVIAVVALMAGYATTLWLTVRRIRAGRSAWWVPLLGFVATMVLVSVCISVPMFGDPAFVSNLGTPPAG
ncbi:DUF6264 family protein [Microbacterium sp. ARD32]|uniref:DUF6264 family protein n=1 Tax=Microbacterium sp. ARD32 TaxID=2962577 RepID=UPI00288134F7|nr:DUF6264 family protein [Microbacterium sp. ARD32]MDT0156624.1 DUF6264 family protein [Microbacterium sp. ARD32]